MKLLLGISLLICWSISTSFGQDLTLKLAAEPPEVLLGIPVLLKVTLTGNRPFVLHGPFGNEHCKLIAKDDSGSPVSFFLPGVPAISQKSPFDSDAKIEYPGKAEYEFEGYLPIGNYNISAQYRSEGPYLDRYSYDDIRPVEGIWIGELTSNIVRVSVNSPKGVDGTSFVKLGPTVKTAGSGEALISFLDNRGKEILYHYPKSTYAAWVRWRWGKRINESRIEMNKSSVEYDFGYSDYLKKMESGELGSTSSFRPDIIALIHVWEPLYENFPKFFYRPQVSKGLAQAYIRIGEYKKARPFIKELLEKFPRSEPAKIAAAYKEFLEKKNIWR